jgi:hypothetical protein
MRKHLIIEWKSTLIMVPATILLASCSPISTYIKEHPNLDPNVAEALRNHTVVTGMTKEQCLLVGSEPERRVQPAPGCEIWEYYHAITAPQWDVDTSSSNYPLSFGISVSRSQQPTGLTERVRLFFVNDSLVSIRVDSGFAISPDKFFPVDPPYVR